RRKLPAKCARQHVRTADQVREGTECTEPAAERRPAVFRSRRDRWRDASHDRDAEGLGRSRAVVDHARPEAGVIFAGKRTRGSATSARSRESVGGNEREEEATRYADLPSANSGAAAAARSLVE